MQLRRPLLIVLAALALLVAMPAAAIAGWAEPAAVGAAPGNDSRLDMQSVQLDDGAIVAMWVAPDTNVYGVNRILAAVNVAGTWGSSFEFAELDGNAGEYYYGFQLGTDGDRVIAAYQTRVGANTTLFSRTLPSSGGVWSAAQTVAILATGDAAFLAPQVEVGSDGTAVIASSNEVADTRGLVIAHQDMGETTWGSEQPFTPDGSGNGDDIRLHMPANDGFDLAMTEVAGDARYTVLWATALAAGNPIGFVGQGDVLELRAATVTSAAGTVGAFGLGQQIVDYDLADDLEFGDTLREIEVGSAGGDSVAYWTTREPGEDGLLRYAVRNSPSATFGAPANLSDYDTGYELHAADSDAAEEIAILVMDHPGSTENYVLRTRDSDSNVFGLESSVLEYSGMHADLQLRYAGNGDLAVYARTNVSGEVLERTRVNGIWRIPTLPVAEDIDGLNESSVAPAIGPTLAGRMLVIGTDYGSDDGGMFTVQRDMSALAFTSVDFNVDHADVDISVAATAATSYHINWGDGQDATDADGDSTHNYASSGWYEVRVTATNGTEVETTPFLVIIDPMNMPPTNPTGATATGMLANVATSTKTVGIELTGYGDDNFVHGFSVVVDQAAATIPDGTIEEADDDFSRTFAGDGSWYIHVRAVDGDGLPAVGSYTVGPFIVDATAPAVPVISGVPTSTTTATSVTLTLASEAQATFVCKIDTQAWAACASTVTFSSLSVGTHTVWAIAYDAVGNASAMAHAEWTVVAPTVVVTTPVAPKNPPVAQITLAPGAAAKLASVAKTGVLPVQLPVSILPGTTVKASLKITAKQAKTIGIKVPKKAKFVVVGSGTLVVPAGKAAAKKLSLKVTLTKSAKTAFGKAAAKTSTVKSIGTTLTLILTKDKVSAKPISKPFAIKK